MINAQDIVQKTIDDIKLNPRRDIMLTIQGEGGKNGNGVAYNPMLKYYFTSIAGNPDFPIDVFTEDGEFVTYTFANADLRGFYYNPEYDLIEGATYSDHDIVSYIFNEDGDMDEGDPVTELTNLEANEDNACFNIDLQNKVYISYNPVDDKVYQYNMDSGKKNKKTITLKIPKDGDNINYTSIIYVDIKGGAYGLLNYMKKQVYLFNPKNGKLIATIQLPKEVKPDNAFNFAYTNNRIFIFDTVERIWTSYKIL